MLVLAVLVINGGLFYVLGRAPTRPNTSAAARIPAYFATVAAALPLPQTLDPNQFSNKSVAMAYQAAKQIPEVLAQLPCYCYCDRIGHRGLLDCFASKHGADCEICVKEALFAMQEHRNGKSAEQIRAEIVHGDWETIQLES
jgi:hypothetical protein